MQHGLDAQSVPQGADLSGGADQQGENTVKCFQAQMKGCFQVQSFFLHLKGQKMGGHFRVIVGFESHPPAFHFAAHIEIIGKLPVVHDGQLRVDIGNKRVGKIDIFHTFRSQADMPDTVGAVDRRDFVAILQFFG